MMTAETLLRSHGLRVTGFRLRVLGLFEGRKAAVDSRTIEQELHPADRVTVYRTLRSFEEAGIIHRIPDTSGNLRFALCHGGCDGGAHHDAHAHFHCSACDLTLCLDDIPVMPMAAPAGFRVSDTQVIFSGTCASCSA